MPRKSFKPSKYNVWDGIKFLFVHERHSTTVCHHHKPKLFRIFSFTHIRTSYIEHDSHTLHIAYIRLPQKKIWTNAVDCWLAKQMQFVFLFGICNQCALKLKNSIHYSHNSLLCLSFGRMWGPIFGGDKGHAVRDSIKCIFKCGSQTNEFPCRDDEGGLMFSRLHSLFRPFGLFTYCVALAYGFLFSWLPTNIHSKIHTFQSVFIH